MQYWTLEDVAQVIEGEPLSARLLGCSIKGSIILEELHR